MHPIWIHHEEIAGTWDWSGSRDLRRFVTTARQVGLKVVVRCGPWCHGKVRNGGLPDFHPAPTLATLLRVELLQSTTVTLTAR